MSDSEDSIEIDSLVVDKCLRCSGDGSSMKLLVCSVIGCPIALHEECMCSKPEIDEKGKFYCPYCAHKRALVRAEKLRRKALGAKEVMSMFIRSGEDSLMMDHKGPVRIEEGIEAGVGGERENEAMEVDENEDEEMDEDVRKGDLEEQCASERNGDNAGGGKDQGDGEESARGNEEDGGRSPGEEEMRPEAVEVPESGDFQRGSPVLHKRRYKKRAQKTVQVLHAIPLRMVSSCQIDEEDAGKQSEEDTISSSSESGKGSVSDEIGKGTASSNSSDIPDLNQNEKVTTSSFELRKASESNRNEKTTASLSSEPRQNLDPSQNEKATAVLPKIRKAPDSNQNEKTASSTEPINVPKSGSEELFFIKKRKVNWTDDELKMLKMLQKLTYHIVEFMACTFCKSRSSYNFEPPHGFRCFSVKNKAEVGNLEGVRHYSVKINKNLPWRKILDHGRHVFHETRTSGNLKDKWQKMCKEATNKQQT